jgi:7-cyano-7-deazaguanine synthase
MENKTKQAVLSLSGGMDSSTLLLHLLSKGYEVTALSFDYGQKHKIELERASELVNYINHTIDNLDFDKKIQWVMRNRDIELENLYVTEAANNMTQIKHQIIKLDGLSQLLNSSLVEGGTEVPEGHYEQDNMKETVVPNRNKIFSSIVQAVALSIADKNETNCVIALGLHSGDHTIYPDTTEEFRLADLNAFKIGNWGSDKVDFYTPYMESNKFGILQDGEKCCKQLDLDFNEIYKRTNTSYKPMKHNGVWYSDYKSASSVERIEAFIKLGLPDPVEYADEIGPVTWEVAKKHVEQILDSHK